MSAFGYLLVASPAVGPSEQLCRLCIGIIGGTVKQAAPSKGLWLLTAILLAKGIACQTVPFVMQQTVCSLQVSNEVQ